MAKKMKLISAALYDRLMTSVVTKHHPLTGATSSTDDAGHVLDSDLPTDIKAKLFHEIKRSQHAYKAEQDNTPVLVKVKESKKEESTPTSTKENIDTTPSPPTSPNSKRRKTAAKSIKWNEASSNRMIGFLESYKITLNADGGVNINGRDIPNSNYKFLVRSLSDARYKKPDGYSDVIEYLAKQHVPVGSVSPTLLKEIMAVQMKSVRSHRPVVQLDEKIIPWESY